MARFDPSKYEDVNVRIKKFYADHDGGSLTTQIEEHTNEYVIVKALLIVDGIVRSTGYAQEFRIFEKATSRSGEEYEPVNMFNYIENAETSAIGRALANFNYSGTKERPSAQEMDKVNRQAGTRPISDKITDAQRRLIFVKLREKNYLTEDQQRTVIEFISGSGSTSQLTKTQASKLIDDIEQLPIQNVEVGESNGTN